MSIRKLLIPLLILAALYCGCAKKTAPIKADYYPACYEPLAYLHDRVKGTGGAVATRAAQGGVISGLATLIVQAITGNLRAAGVAVGTAAGAAVGGLVGGASHYDEIQKRDTRHLSKYLDEIDGDVDISNMDLKEAAATVSRQCYKKAFRELIQQTRDGELSSQAARARFEEIAAGDKEASQILETPSSAEEMAGEFAAAERR